ncbi:zinc-dependent metalloprotease [Rhodococcus spongiicola]|uniref:Hydrolase n=1 Tax=Rhodococcus spongiicola TaxID=2487352 RepID=A0A3S3E714_9NOCA|nr:zinc-dependent metalloprotease [Rhodococcus spongiicola]RVW06817.1 hydrolase [Rhodococcus spongiicola]
MTTADSDSRFGGAVDWGLAARTGVRLAPAGPVTSRYTAEAVVADLESASFRAEAPVRGVTGLADGLPTPSARVVDRAGWVRAAAQSMAHLTGSDVDPQRSALAGKTGGVQAGAMLAYLSSAILGQYDPFTGEHGTLLLVAPNVLQVERTLAVPARDFRLWVCLHEVTHRVQFSSAPWMGDYMRSSVATLGESSKETMAEFVSRLSSALRDRRRGEDLPVDQRGIIGLVRATQAEPQRAALDRMLVLGTVLEGHADHVMDAVGPDVVPSVVRIRRAFDARRRRRTTPVQRILRALLGVDAKMAQYVRGKRFVDAVVGRVGMDRFNTIWTGPETMPTLDEIEHPDAWIARVLG